MHREESMDKTIKQRRGGRRENAGRRSLLGPTVRRDIRLPEHVVVAAIRIGKGSFADGLRIMCQEYIRTSERDVRTEPPPAGEPVLIRANGERWAIARAIREDDKVIFCEDGQPDTLHTAEAWRPLPLADELA